MSLISGLTSSGGIILGAIQSKKNRESTEQMNANNLIYQRERDESQEALMRESWLRDDNAVQRRAADLSAAGISPLMAAGSAAANSGPINLQGQSQKEAPKTDYSAVINSIFQGVNAIKMMGDLENQTQQVQLAKGRLGLDQHNSAVKNNLAQEKMFLDADLGSSKMNALKAGAMLAKQNAANAYWNYTQSKKRGLRTNDTPSKYGKIAVELKGVLKNALPNLLPKGHADTFDKVMRDDAASKGRKYWNGKGKKPEWVKQYDK